MSYEPLRHDPARLERMAPVRDRIPPHWGKWLPEPGWDGLLLALDARLSRLDEGYVIYQAKEKFGTLRFYVEWSEDLPRDLRAAGDRTIDTYEVMSARVCEMCGTSGAKARTGGWIKTLCDNCAEVKKR